MSYDLNIFAPEDVAMPGLLELVGSAAGLAVLDNPEGGDGGGFIRVGRGARREYAFTVEGPFTVEAEDLPEEVTAAVVGVSVLYQVLVEGSSDTAVPYATRFARKLAKTLGGVVVDEQTGLLWPAKSQRALPRPPRETTIDVVEMRWYFLLKEQADNLPEIYLRLARKYLPEVLPRRYGSYEPMQGNLERDGDQAFIDACERDRPHLIFLVGSYPAGLGLLSHPTAPDPVHRKSRHVGYVTVLLDRSALHNPAWRKTAEKFFTELAIASHSFFATAEVLRGYVKKNRGFDTSATSERNTDPLSAGRWIGLPPYPLWWTWAGPSYASILTPHLHHGRTQQFGESMFHAWAEEPVDRDQIAQLLPDPARTWIPAKYSPTHTDGHFPTEAAETPAAIYHGPVIR